MPSLEYFILCEGAALDQLRNRPSFFHVIEQEIVRQDFPWTIPQIIAFSSWLPGPEDAGRDFQVLLHVHVPGNETPGIFPKNFTQDRRRTRLLQSLYNLRLPQPGELRFELLLNGTLIATRSVAIGPME
jgi:hypothetical protein